MLPLDPKAYELKTEVIILPHTERTVRKQAQGNYNELCHLKRGKMGSHRPLTILKFRSTHATPFPHAGHGHGHGGGSPLHCSPWLLAPPSGTSSFPITLLHHF